MSRHMSFLILLISPILGFLALFIPAALKHAEILADIDNIFDLFYFAIYYSTPLLAGVLLMLFGGVAGFFAPSIYKKIPFFMIVGFCIASIFDPVSDCHSLLGIELFIYVLLMLPSFFGTYFGKLLQSRFGIKLSTVD